MTENVQICKALIGAGAHPQHRCHDGRNALMYHIDELDSDSSDSSDSEDEDD